jgi:hypothetical protein
MARTLRRRYAPIVAILGLLAVLLVTVSVLVAPGRMADRSAIPRTDAGSGRR